MERAHFKYAYVSVCMYVCLCIYVCVPVHICMCGVLVPSYMSVQGCVLCVRGCSCSVSESLFPHMLMKVCYESLCIFAHTASACIFVKICVYAKVTVCVNV